MFRKLLVVWMAALLLAACAGTQSVIPETALDGAGEETQSLPTAGSGASNPSPDDPVSSDDPVAPAEDPWKPAPGDENLQLGPAQVESHELLILESFPVQYRLLLAGTLPTPCHQLRVEVSEPDAENRIMVDVYSLVNPDEMCMQVLEPFEVSVPLGSYESGEYSVWMNGEQIAEFAP